MRTNFTYIDKTNGQFCHYCGELPQAVDHCPAIAVVHSRGIEYFREEKIPLILVDVCTECNNALGHRDLLTLSERRVFIQGYYLKKYEKVIFMPEWKEEEIQELGYSLQHMIRIGLKAKAAISLRLLWMGGKEQLKPLKSKKKRAPRR